MYKVIAKSPKFVIFMEEAGSQDTASTLRPLSKRMLEAST